MIMTVHYLVIVIAFCHTIIKIDIALMLSKLFLWFNL